VMYALLAKKPLKPLIAKEQRYITSKARDVVHLLGYKWKGGSGGLSLPRHQQESTHVISYYILKGVNWYYLSDFLEGYVPWDHDNYVQMLSGFLNRPTFWKFSQQSAALTNRSMKMSSLDIYRLVYTKKDKLLKSLLTR